MKKWNVHAYLNETIEADSEFEAEQIGLEMVERWGIRATESEEEKEKDENG